MEHDEDDPPLVREPLARFVELLERVQDGAVAPDSLADEDHPLLEDGYCLYNLYEELRAAFKYQPGRVEAIAPILALARKALGYERDDTLRLFNEPEWKRLVEMRGPVEAVAIQTCRDCGMKRVDFYLSGFTEEFAAVCDRCGDALFQGTYDERPLPPCKCGGAFHRNHRCPRCGSGDADVEQRSSYEYFASHSWTRR